MTKHTPGPWVTDPRYFGNVYCDDATGSLVAKCGRFEFVSRPAEELAANTRLIAAAPDLLAALEAMVEFYDSDGLENGAAEQARAAIAKTKI